MALGDKAAGDKAASVRRPTVSASDSRPSGLTIDHS